MDVTGVSTTRERSETRMKVRKPVIANEAAVGGAAGFCKSRRKPSIAPESVKIVMQHNDASICLEILRIRKNRGRGA